MIPSPPSEFGYVPQAGKQVQEQRNEQGSIQRDGPTRPVRCDAVKAASFMMSRFFLTYTDVGNTGNAGAIFSVTELQGRRKHWQCRPVIVPDDTGIHDILVDQSNCQCDRLTGTMPSCTRTPY